MKTYRILGFGKSVCFIFYFVSHQSNVCLHLSRLCVREHRSSLWFIFYSLFTRAVRFGFLFCVYGLIVFAFLSGIVNVPLSVDSDPRVYFGPIPVKRKA